MTSFELERVAFNEEAVSAWAPLDPRHTNWPVVYVLDNAAEDAQQRRRSENDSQVYVGESRNAAARMRQHFDSPKKKDLRTIRVIVDETFNKSACLDLESSLIRWLSGDGTYL